MTIRPETPADYAQVYALIHQAFGQEDESRLVERIRASGDYIPELSLVAEEDGIVKGHILFSKIQIKGEQAYPTLALAPVAVRPEFQNQGIGGKLIREGLKIAQALGHTSVIVLGHKAYYPKFGFTKASNWGIQCPFKVDEENFMAIELARGALEGKQGTVEYGEAFLEG